MYKGKNYCEKNYEIVFKDINEEGRCKVTTMISYLTDIALAHAEAGGLDFFEEIKDGRSLIFVDYSLKINKYPTYREIITVKTYVELMEKFYAIRKYYGYNSKGEQLFEAEALGLTFDIKNRKMLKVPDEYFDLYGVERKKYPKPHRVKIADINEITEEHEFEIRHTDKDRNRHVNNTKYVEWAINVFSHRISDLYKVESIDVKFEREIQTEDLIKIQGQLIEKENGYEAIYKFIDTNDNKETTRMKINWIKNDN